MSAPTSFRLPVPPRGLPLRSGALLVVAGIAVSAWSLATGVSLRLTDGGLHLPKAALTLQPMVTGSLGLIALAIALEARAGWHLSARMLIAPIFVAATLAAPWVGEGRSFQGELLAISLFVALPTVAIVGGLLWWTARLLPVGPLQTGLLAGVVIAAGLAESQVFASNRRAEEQALLIPNSLLIGLALLTWLLVWSSRPLERRRA